MCMLRFSSCHDWNATQLPWNKWTIPWDILGSGLTLVGDSNLHLQQFKVNRSSQRILFLPLSYFRMKRACISASDFRLVTGGRSLISAQCQNCRDTLKLLPLDRDDIRRRGINIHLESILLDKEITQTLVNKSLIFLNLTLISWGTFRHLFCCHFLI